MDAAVKSFADPDNHEQARIGVVLSSGGGRGVYAHTGFLSALESLEIEIAVISGCSAGALVGGVYASGTALDRWSTTIANVKTKDYWNPDSLLHFLWDVVVRKGRGYSGFSDARTAIGFIRSNLTAKRFEDCKIPFYSLAMNLSRGTKMLFTKGELAPRIMASAAMPVLYRPVEIDNEWYSDGAVIDLAPIESICCKHNLDVVIVHHAAMNREGTEALASARNSRWSLIEILYLQLYRQRSWYMSDQALSFHRCPSGCGATIIVVNPNLPELVWPLSQGGRDVQAAAMEQSLNLLRPHMSELKAAPRQLLFSRQQKVVNLHHGDNDVGAYVET